MDKRKDPSSVDIKKVLLEMRKFRMGLIQTADQLRFSYLAVIEGAKFIMGDSSVQVSIAFAFMQVCKFSIFVSEEGGCQLSKFKHCHVSEQIAVLRG